MSRLLKGVHILYTGSNGVPTYGIEIRCHPSCEGNKAYCQTVRLNDYTILKYGVAGLVDYGLSEDEANLIIKDIIKHKGGNYERS